MKIITWFGIGAFLILVMWLNDAFEAQSQEIYYATTQPFTTPFKPTPFLPTLGISSSTPFLLPTAILPTYPPQEPAYVAPEVPVFVIEPAYMPPIIPVVVIPTQTPEPRWKWADTILQICRVFLIRAMD